jgi:hypothetical protein
VTKVSRPFKTPENIIKLGASTPQTMFDSAVLKIR